MAGKGMRGWLAISVLLGVGFGFGIGKRWVGRQAEKAPVGEVLPAERALETEGVGVDEILADLEDKTLTVSFQIINAGEEDLIETVDKDEFPPGDYHPKWPPRPELEPGKRPRDFDSWDRRPQ